VTKEKELTGAIQEAFRFDSKVLIEKGIEGREIECSVLGTNLKPKASLPGEIIPSEKIGWYNYEAKYLLSDGAKIIIPADLNKKEVSEIQNFAIKIFQVMGCEGFARIDIFLEKKTGQILLNEVNTVPGFTPISMYPKMWEASGLSYQELITKLIELAGQRGK
jgi:D-alanine-D-alanine ligase